MDIFNEFFTDSGIYFNIFDQMTDEVFIFDNHCRLQYCNKGAEKSEGFLLKDVKGKSIFELYDFEHDLSRERSPALIALTKEHPINNAICPYYVNNVEKIKVISSAPIYRDGTLVGAYTVQHDLTQIKDIVNQNIALQKAISKQRELFPSANDTFSPIIGTSNAMTTCVHIAKQAAQTNSSVMLVGDTGTGKEIFARAIHEAGNRAKRPFLALNCAAIPETLIESILFGTTKGAFTDAVEKDGLLMQANTGTVFLDEINSMPLSSQAKLLRVLEEKRITKLGGSKSEKVDIRLICSTNEDPEQAIKAHHMREDLYYRLSVVQINIPPLRKRKEDIPLLVEHFINEYNEQFQKNIHGIETDAMSLLMNYHWPGNVRQLKACIESAMNFSIENENISTSILPMYLFHKETTVKQQVPVFSPTLEQETDAPSPRRAIGKSELRIKAAEKEKQAIAEALQKHNGNISQTAKELHISRSLLYYRLKKYHLD